MTKACCICKYYNEYTAKCRNPESVNYERCMLPSKCCDKWRYEKEVGGPKHGEKR